MECVFRLTKSKQQKNIWKHSAMNAVSVAAIGDSPLSTKDFLLLSH